MQQVPVSSASSPAAASVKREVLSREARSPGVRAAQRMTKRRWLTVKLIFGAAVAIGLVAYHQSGPPDSRFPDRRTAMVEINGARVVAEVAASEESQARGLSGRPRLSPDHGMLFTFPVATKPFFWMKGMNASIDIVWINGRRVADVTPRLPVPTGSSDERLPWYQPSSPVDEALEVSTGWVSTHHVEVGDPVDVRPG